MPFFPVDGERAVRTSFTAEELRSLRAAIDRSPRAPLRFPIELERCFQDYVRRESAVARALLALVPAIFLAGIAFFADAGLAAIGGASLAGVAWFQARCPAQAASEWLLIAALALLVPFMIVLSYELGPQAHEDTWDLLIGVPIGAVALAHLRFDRAILLAVAYVAAMAGADYLSDGTYDWTLVDAAIDLALLSLVAMGMWRLRRSMRHSWACTQLLRMQANHDFLTGLPNRRALELHYRRVAREHSGTRPRGILALVLVDLDYFKLINDHYGHEYGDRVIQRIGRELALIPVQPGEFSARLAGEQFVLLLAAATPDQLTRRVEDVLRRIEYLKVPHVRSPYGRVTATAGWAPVHAGSRFSEPYALAETAMYRAKTMGRNVAQGADTSVVSFNTPPDPAAA